MSDSSSKLIQQPQIRASDGQKASLKIGERVPVATGSFQPGIGGVGINPLVNTQFNYIDVGVNIDITPRVHGLDEITLKLAMDISAIDSYQNIGGISQPVIGQRKIENEIRLKEGEVNILGGILENTQTKSLSGIPGLASIPLFKYLFADEQKEVNDNEIVFILIPHIVRAQDIFPSNLKAIDVGTANTISLRRDNSQAANQPPGNAQPGAPPGAMNNPATQSRSAGAATSWHHATRQHSAHCGHRAGRQCDPQLRSANPGSGSRFHVHRKRKSRWRPECLLGSGADPVQPARLAAAERFQRDFAFPGRADRCAGQSRRQHGWNSAIDGVASSWGQSGFPVMGRSSP